MGDYIVELTCPVCGKVHLVSNGLLLENGPTEPGSLDDLYSKAPLPPPLMSLLHDLVWCEVTERWVSQTDRRRVYLAPKRWRFA